MFLVLVLIMLLHLGTQKFSSYVKADKSLSLWGVSQQGEFSVIHFSFNCFNFSQQLLSKYIVSAYTCSFSLHPLPVLGQGLVLSCHTCTAVTPGPVQLSHLDLYSRPKRVVLLTC